METGSYLALALSLSCAFAESGDGVGVLRQLQFSPDGKYVLAQDDSRITVLTADPLRVRFRVEADKQVPGRFTPDSREIVFVKAMTQVTQDEIHLPTGNPHVEHWRISDCRRVAEVPIPDLACGTAALAPDGGTLACDDLKGTLHVIDVASGEETLTKRKFSLPLTDDGYLLQEPHLWAANLEFSPDGRLLIALPDDNGVAVVWDPGGRKTLKSEGEIRLLSKQAGGAPSWTGWYAQYKLIWRTDSFAFVAPDKLAIMRTRWVSWKESLKCSADTVTFPAGVVVSTHEIPHCPVGLSYGSGRVQRPFRRAADPRFLIIDYEEGLYYGMGSGETARVETLAVEMKTGRIIQSDSAALDVYGNHYVDEVRPGVVGMWDVDKGLQTSVVVSKQ